MKENKRENNWICGKCEQELKFPNAEIIPQHSKHCIKRNNLLDDKFNIKRDDNNNIIFNF